MCEVNYIEMSNDWCGIVNTDWVQYEKNNCADDDDDDSVCFSGDSTVQLASAQKAELEIVGGFARRTIDIATPHVC